MILRVKFLCHNCRHINKQELGMPGFELIDCEWENFSSAHRHLIEFPDHDIDITVTEESEEE